MHGKTSFTRDELIACAKGDLFGLGNAQLPAPPLLMFDRITYINPCGGSHQRGLIQAELDIHPDCWFFKSHFIQDPVMPGCLGIDALWQMSGFYLAWLGHPGQGRALGCGQVKFSGQVTPKNRKVSYQIDVIRTITRQSKLIITHGQLWCDDKKIYTVDHLKVGLFNQLKNTS